MVTPNIGFKLKNEIFLRISGIIIGGNIKINGNKSEAVTEILNNVSNLFKDIRTITNQYDLDFRSHSWMLQHGDFKPRMSRSKIEYSNIQEIGMAEYIFQTYFDWDEIKKIDKIRAKGILLPIYRELMLDSIEALLSQDYRKAILYACMACESNVSYKLLDKYLGLKKRKKLKYSFTNAKSGDIDDPVYKELNKSDKFSNKIHEQSLYILNKSLLVENEKLYQGMINMYKTRNKIVHEGEVKNYHDKNLLSIDEKGAEKAIEYSIGFFNWLGENDFDIFKKRGFKVFR